MKDFKEILDAGTYDSLTAYQDPISWESLSQEEREMLAYLFVKMGEKLLRETGDPGNSFHLATSIAPSSASIYYFQAETLLNHTRHVQHLIDACTLIEKASTLSSDFDIWYVWAVILTRLGAKEEESLYLQDALSKYVKAKECALNYPPEKLANFYYDWGQTWFFLGKLSGEALDFKNALDLFQIVAKTDFMYAPFWTAYGDAMVELAFLIGKTEMFYEAADFYQKSLKLDSKLFISWLNLGCTYQVIFEFSGEESFYFKAVDCFKHAEDVAENPKISILWLKWGRLMVSYAKMNHDTALLEASFEKFEKADNISPNETPILSRWAEAQMLLGGSADKIDLLKDAESKLLSCLELQPDNSENWYLYGVCLKELGRYFNEISYYEKAIEKFQTGLSLNQTDVLLWHALALTYYALGDIGNDGAMLEKAVKYCARVVEFGGTRSVQFWNDWGVALMRLAEVTNELAYIEEALEKFSQIIHLQDEGSLSLVDLEWLYNYGCALDFHGDFTENESSYEKAIQVLNYVISQDPEYYHARYNLALAFSHLGESVSDVECLQKACDHFEILLGQDPEDEIAWCDWGLALMHLAQLMHEPIRPDHSQKLYEQAENKFLHAAALGSQGSFYHLACLKALADNFSHAMIYLEKSQAAGSLPILDDLLNDEWLESLKETTAFKDFISQISSKQEKK